MNLELSRVIVFAQNLDVLASFYAKVLGLPEKLTPDDPRTWREFQAGACSIALHNGGMAITEGRAPKIVFYVSDVATARDTLNARGANFGRVITTQAVLFCNGTDPEGNALQLSNRQ